MKAVIDSVYNYTQKYLSLKKSRHRLDESIIKSRENFSACLKGKFSSNPEKFHDIWTIQFQIEFVVAGVIMNTYTKQT